VTRSGDYGSRFAHSPFTHQSVSHWLSRWHAHPSLRCAAQACCHAAPPREWDVHQLQPAITTRESASNRLTYIT
jgi:hypothetical protein